MKEVKWVGYTSQAEEASSIIKLKQYFNILLLYLKG